MNNDFFNNAQMLSWMKNFSSQIDWDSWMKNMQKHNSEFMNQAGAKLNQDIQNLTHHNARNVERNMALAMDALKHNLSASSMEQVIANNQKVGLEILANNLEHSKENFSQMAASSAEIYSQFNDHMMHSMDCSCHHESKAQDQKA